MTSPRSQYIHGIPVDGLGAAEFEPDPEPIEGDPPELLNPPGPDPVPSGPPLEPFGLEPEVEPELFVPPEDSIEALGWLRLRLVPDRMSEA